MHSIMADDKKLSASRDDYLEGEDTPFGRSGLFSEGAGGLYDDDEEEDSLSKTESRSELEASIKSNQSSKST